MPSHPLVRRAALGALRRSALAASIPLAVGVAQAQEARAPAGGSVTLDELRIEGDGRGGAGIGTPGTPRGIETAKGPVSGYVATTSATATKTDTPLIRTPQSISVVGTEQIRAQAAQTVSEAVRYTPGIFANQFGQDPRVDWFIIRGFSATEGGLYRDGLQLFQTGFANYKVDAFGAERIEVLRGPSATLFGGSPVGGLVNIVSKRPPLDPLRYVEVGGGSFNQVYAAFDVGGPVDQSGHWFYRVTGRVQKADAPVALAGDDRYYIAPSLTYKPDGATTFTLLTSFQRDEAGGIAQFLPYLGTVRPQALGIRIDRRFNSSDPLVDGYSRNQANVGYEFETHLSDVWTVRQNLRYSFTEVQDQRYVGNGYANTAQTELARYGFLTTPHAGTFAVDNQAEARFSDGLFGHTVLMGIDYKNYSLFDNQASTFPVPSINILSPRYFQASARPLPYLVANQNLQQLGLYAQDQIRLTERLTFLIGGRQDFVTNDVVNKLAGTAVRGDDSAFTGRLGLIYNFDNGLAPYVTYGTSFNPTVGTDASGNPFKPDRGDQIEVGAKFQPVGWNSFFTVAAFDLQRSNVLTPNPANVFTNLQIGAVRSRGVEASFTANLVEGLNVVAAVTSYDLKTVEGTTLDLGKVPVGIPQTFASLWGDYTIPFGEWKGFGFGGGVRYVGESFADVANTLRVSEYVLFDAAVHYERDGWRAALNIQNAGDRRFVSSCSTATACFYGEQRRITASLGYRW
ncbi:TonB-dependent siderophore receptor [Methylobacterium sp. Leaf466]|uniref:TonB-dependent siderophore receptor n=1 Tax=Methylobacterium sp. Leaf466 TaxID=1736386 RepID=UPI0006FBA539|nr:TonB-dependent siderophore receptor [Methylobacterium sp. Leaf466]KQT80840.1 TonB-dependent receptor [Methylobacterium sp. Leaf466]